MPIVTVTPPSSITVRVGGTRQPRVTSQSQFLGSPVNQAEIDTAFAVANASFLNANTALTEVGAAYNQSNTAAIIANSALLVAQTNLPLAGGEITGNLTVDGVFTATIDGGTFS
jgi:hypothetical protein